MAEPTTALQRAVLALIAEHPDWSTARIAQAAGCTKGAVWKIRNLDRVRELNRRSDPGRVRRRRFEESENGRGRCKLCGYAKGIATARKNDLCQYCSAHERHRVYRRIIHLARLGFTRSEIAERIGWTKDSVQVEMSRMRARGIALPDGRISAGSRTEGAMDGDPTKGGVGNG